MQYIIIGIDYLSSKLIYEYEFNIRSTNNDRKFKRIYQ